MKRPLSLSLSALVAIALASQPAAAQNRYVIHDNPWGAGSSIDDNWTNVFGATGYQQLGYTAATTNFASIFTAATRLVWLDGGADTDATFQSFLSSNRSTIEGWVASGGRLVLNAAPWYTPNIDLGFGGFTLNHEGPNATSYGFTGNVGATLQGPNPLTTNSLGGSYFSHAFITGSPLITLITDEYGRTTLGSTTFGNGSVMFGGLTSDNFHSPSQAAQNLSDNILYYADGMAAGAVTPEPASMALMGTGLLGLGVIARLRRRAGTQV